MERVIQYRISDPIPGQKISGYLKTHGYSEQNRVNLKKDPDSIWLNGVRVHQNHLLEDGDRLEVRIHEFENSDQILPVQLPIEIVYEDEDLMVVNKAAGMPIHPSRNNPDNSLGNALAWYFKEKGRTFVFRCINRLDRDTSGLTIIAKHMVSGAVLSQMVAAKSKEGLQAEGIHREYLAIVKGAVNPPLGTINVPIARKESVHLERMVDFSRGERAITHYQVIKEHDGYSLVALQLETGRTHQIRVHMKYIGYPLIGDFVYNPDMTRISRQALHAWKLTFPHPITGEHMEFTAPLPRDMSQIIEGEEHGKGSDPESKRSVQDV